jgi:hypothetical protein
MTAYTASVIKLCAENTQLVGSLTPTASVPTTVTAV